MGRSKTTSVRGRRSGRSLPPVGQDDTTSKAKTATKTLNNFGFQEHALLNSLIVTKILEFLKPDVNDLKQLRQVCKLWYELTLSKWRSTAVVEIVPEPLLFNRKLIEGFPVLEFFQKFQTPHQTFQEFREKPFSRYKFKGLCVDINACDDEGDSKLFWELIGPHVKYVHFQNCTILATRDKAFVQLLVRKLPNVEELEVTDVEMDKKPEGYDHYRQDAIAIPKSDKIFKISHKNLKSLTYHGSESCMGHLEDLFLLAPNLETIRGRDGRIKKITEFGLLNLIVGAAKSLRTFKEYRASKAFSFLPGLRHLDIIDTSTLTECRVLDIRQERLVSLNLKLETLSLRLKPYFWHGHAVMTPVGITDGNMEVFLASQSKTLQVLTIFRVPLCHPFETFLYAARMTALRELYLWGPISSSFQFLWYTPNLRILYINMYCFEKREQVKDALVQERKESRNVYFKRYEEDMVQLVDGNSLGNVVVSHLDSLHIDVAFPVKSWELLGKWMPHLKILRAVLTKDTVPVVCNVWKHLVELGCLHRSSIEDRNIICSSGKGKRDGGGNSIGDLQYLEKFQLDSVCGGSTLTDACVYEGFLKMPELKSVQICVSKKMSEKAEKVLRSSIDYCRVIRNYLGGDHSNYDCCERKKFYEDCDNGLPTKVDSDSSSESEQD